MKCKWCGSDKVIRYGSRGMKQLWRCKSCKRYFYFGLKREKKKASLVFNYSLGYVIGVLMGDGSLSRWKDYHHFDEKGRQVPKSRAIRTVPRYRYGFQLQCKDEDFALTFAKHLQIVTNRKPCVYSISRRMTVIAGNPLQRPYIFYGFAVRLTCKEWYFKLKPLIEDLSWIRNSNSELKKGFLRGLFDSDGSVIVRKGTCRAEITLTNKDEKLILLTRDLLKDLGINSHIYRYPEILKLYIGTKEDVMKFYKIVGFSIKRKLEKISSVLRTKHYSGDFSTPHHEIP